MFNKLISIFYWIKIFLSPIFATVLFIVILSNIWYFTFYYTFLFVPASIIGIYIAEKARKYYGTSNFDSTLSNISDLVETWEKDKK